VAQPRKSRRAKRARHSPKGDDGPPETLHDLIRVQFACHAQESKHFAMNASSVGILSVGDVGSFGELKARTNPDGLALVYIPGLAALLERAKQLKGSELSERESARIAEHATVMAVTPEMAKETIESRGYA